MRDRTLTADPARGPATNSTIVLLIACLAALTGAMALGSAAVPRAEAQSELRSVTYAAGWNLVAAPTASELTGATGPQYAARPTSSQYEAVAAGEIVGGRGVWAYFAVPTTVELTATAAQYTQVQAPAGHWELVGDPSTTATLPIRGADAALVYDTTQQTYVPATTVAPGQGVWVMRNTDGPVEIGGTPSTADRQRAIELQATGNPTDITAQDRLAALGGDLVRGNQYDQVQAAQDDIRSAFEDGVVAQTGGGVAELDTVQRTNLVQVRTSLAQAQNAAQAGELMAAGQALGVAQQAAQTAEAEALDQARHPGQGTSSTVYNSLQANPSLVTFWRLFSVGLVARSLGITLPPEVRNALQLLLAGQPVPPAVVAPVQSQPQPQNQPQPQSQQPPTTLIAPTNINICNNPFVLIPQCNPTFAPTQTQVCPAPGATLSLTPPNGPPSTPVHVQFTVTGLDALQPLTITSNPGSVSSLQVFGNTGNQTAATGGASGSFVLNTGTGGTQTITASTSGGRCAQAPFTVQTVNGACTGTLVLSPSAGPANSAVSVQFTVHGLDPSQTLTIGSSNQGVPQASVSPNMTDGEGSATGTFHLSTGQSGTLTLTASTTGGRCAQAPFAVRPATTPTNTALSSSANPSASGQAVTFTAAVSAASTTTGLPPTGSVIFLDGTTVLGTGTLTGTSPLDQATFTTSTLAVGTHSITAIYNGDSNFASSTSSPLSQVVLGS